ncbi:hypothetical protein MRB53_015837 [Persea americana]|uniref:Uncharacterized protein n=1 Tax=Persea americana TaxID=3435 RepID=A0ACC2M0H8_PERAE|nr:hypothetical protein MRB53_015837 [Persea americana]
MASEKYPAAIFAFIWVISVSCNLLSSSSSSEADALFQWKSTLQSHSLNSWSLTNGTNTSPCSWIGISCNDVGKVVEISLPNASLQVELNFFRSSRSCGFSNGASSCMFTGGFLYRLTSEDVPQSLLHANQLLRSLSTRLGYFY